MYSLGLRPREYIQVPSGTNPIHRSYPWSNYYVYLASSCVPRYNKPTKHCIPYYACAQRYNKQTKIPSAVYLATHAHRGITNGQTDKPTHYYNVAPPVNKGAMNHQTFCSLPHLIRKTTGLAGLQVPLHS